MPRRMPQTAARHDRPTVHHLEPQNAGKDQQARRAPVSVDSMLGSSRQPEATQRPLSDHTTCNAANCSASSVERPSTSHSCSKSDVAGRSELACNTDKYVSEQTIVLEVGHEAPLQTIMGIMCCTSNLRVKEQSLALIVCTCVTTASLRMLELLPIPTQTLAQGGSDTTIMNLMLQHELMLCIIAIELSDDMFLNVMATRSIDA
eukprot:6490641-Amphidinium_carterae.2